MRSELSVWKKLKGSTKGFLVLPYENSFICFGDDAKQIRAIIHKDLETIEGVEYLILPAQDRSRWTATIVKQSGEWLSVVYY